MSRRNYNKSEQEPLPPFYDDLVFWAPLTEGDLTDHISGVELTANQNATITWNSVECAYIFSVPGSVTAGTGIELPGVSINLGDVLSDIEYTCVIDINVNAATREQFPILSTNRQFWKLSWYGGKYSTNKWIRLCSVKESGQLLTKEYEDGRFIEQSQQNVSSSLGTYLFTRPSWCYGFIALAKNARIYNRALTAEEVAQL